VKEGGKRKNNEKAGGKEKKKDLIMNDRCGMSKRPP
jgi:hypothetical protein